MAEVSVIIPTHNRAHMVRRAIESVLAQTWQDFEIVVISDGSKDSTDEVVASFVDNRIRLLKHERERGASAARNTGLQASSGGYIAFLDDDDEWLPDKLRVQLDAIRQSDSMTGLVYCWIEYVLEGKMVRQRPVGARRKDTTCARRSLDVRSHRAQRPQGHSSLRTGHPGLSLRSPDRSSRPHLKALQSFR